ncbi:MAG TPA: fumarylacetoacetate hydrolase family protein [Acidimicrobiia bacterium]|jgi:2-keto-4-pentenoate hydratase/2-oxohepta-3-ene-1,7-dioic acid hydratase in catechol pathway|nr:fumarylacetoacetate hydrolase family protein [Acidimicrobiia bacterium]
MRWATFVAPGDARARAGLVVDDAIHALAPATDLLALLGDDGTILHDAARRAERQPDFVIPLADARLRAPIPRPPSVRDFYAFEQHVRTARERRGLEMEPDWYELPVFYFSNPASIVGDGDDVAMPDGTAELDFELEVAAVMGGPARIAGFTVMNDWSARDIQRREMKLNLGPAKGKDFATTLGPFLVTPDELEDAARDKAYDLTMTASVNGREYSRASLADIYWSFDEMIAYAARGTTLRAGDVIGSGTCGTGCILELSLVHGVDAYPWLQPGDEVSLTVDRLGTITNRVRQES